MPDHDFTRRDFLLAGAVATAGALTAKPALATPPPSRAKRCIVLLMIGGPSQLETFDPKPDAPSEVRGPFDSIATAIPGVRFCEHLPKLASLAHRFAVIRSLNHSATPAHEVGLQMLQTGRAFAGNAPWPHFGAGLSSIASPTSSSFVVLPGPLGNLGMNLPTGQDAGWLGKDHEPSFRRAGTFAQSCQLAVALAERGSRCVVVNQFDELAERVTWDCHAEPIGLRSTLDNYRQTLCPAFDGACAGLIEDLRQRGMLDETLVVAMGEMGRTPRLNANGGRDHWTGAWSMLLAGGGVRGGQVIGATDRAASEPTARPVSPAEVVASIYHAFGMPVELARRLVDAEPIRELFR